MLRSLLAIALLPLIAPAAAAEPVLEVFGAVASGPRTFTLAQLEALGTSSIRTSGPWIDDVPVFEGVPLARLLDEVGAHGEMLSIVALNDYVVDVPVSDAALHGPILAMKRDGIPMPVADKGPLFLVYPYDSDPELQTDVYYARSVWQIATIEVR